MLIYESENELPESELVEQRRRIREALPGMHFDDAYIVNHITGGFPSYSSFGVHSLVTVFPNIGVAVLNDETAPDVAERLMNLGYHVPARKTHAAKRPIYRLMEGTNDSYIRVSPREADVTEDAVLWEELKSGFGHETIRRKLSELLYPLISLPGVSEYEFAYYEPDIGDSSIPDDYVEPTGIFRLPPENAVDGVVHKLASVGTHTPIALTSRVMTTDGERHIPMIDFMENVDTCKPLDRNAARGKNVR